MKKRVSKALIKALERASIQASKAWKDIPGLRFVAVGRKRVGGTLTMTPSIIAYLDRKRPHEEIEQKFFIPEKFEGFDTDVEVCGVPSRASLPIMGGKRLSSTFYSSANGTLGCIAYKLDANGAARTGEIVGLTCAHCISNSINELNIGALVKIVERNTDTSSTTDPLVGAPTYCPLCHCGVGYDGVVTYNLPKHYECDAGLVTLRQGKEWVAEIEEIGAVTGTRTIEAWELIWSDPIFVKKFGVTTALTSGKIRCIIVAGASTWSSTASSLVLDGVSEVESFRTEGKVLVVEYDPTYPRSDKQFADHGDSGSAVVDADGKVVGILTSICGPKTTNTEGYIRGSIACVDAIDLICEKLKIEIATDSSTGGVTMTVPDAEVDYPLSCDEVEDESEGSGGGEARYLGENSGGSGKSSSFTKRKGMPLRGGLGTLVNMRQDVLTELNKYFGEHPYWMKLREMVNPHLPEIVYLVNQNRACMVTWHRNQGPMLLAKLVSETEEGWIRLEEFSLRNAWLELLKRMIPVLMAHGSLRLKTSLAAARADFIGFSDQAWKDQAQVQTKKGGAA